MYPLGLSPPSLESNDSAGLVWLSLLLSTSGDVCDFRQLGSCRGTVRIGELGVADIHGRVISAARNGEAAVERSGVASPQLCSGLFK